MGDSPQRIGYHFTFTGEPDSPEVMRARRDAIALMTAWGADNESFERELDLVRNQFLHECLSGALNDSQRLATVTKQLFALIVQLCSIAGFGLTTNAMTERREYGSVLQETMAAVAEGERKVARSRN